MLIFKDVGLRIKQKQILAELNFKVLPGELVGVIGASGAGKSSLFKLLLAEIKPTSGEVLLDDISLRDLSFGSVQKYRRQVGVVFQDFRLLPQKTVFENVAFALEVCDKESEIKTKGPQLLELVGLTDRQKAFPRDLSGGEQQRTAIARALAHEPKIFIADEATGNLDPKNSREIAELFLKLNRETNLTILFSTHDPLLIEQLQPRVIRLEEGFIKFDTNHQDPSELFAGLL